MSTPPPHPRLPAQKNRNQSWLIYHTLVQPSIRRTFQRVAVSNHLGAIQRGLVPTLLYANHVSWWDGYMAFVLEQREAAEFYMMMEEAQLSRYRFFQRCGCFSVDRSDAREGLRSVQYAAELLRQNHRRTLWIFPQGEITPNDRRPLVTYSGTAHIAKRIGEVRAAPVALRYEFFGEQRPEALIRLGPAHVIKGGNASTIQAEMDERLLQEVDALHQDVISGATARYTTILKGRQSINVWWDRVRGKSPKV